jgi:ribonuclease-3
MAPTGPGPRSWPTALRLSSARLYLDQGYAAAQVFITDSILSTFDDILASGSWMDPKSHLQELAQSQETATPVYKVMNEDGPDHDKTFTVGVYVGGKLRGQGNGPSKQAAQQQAAEAALASYKKPIEIETRR